MIVRIVQMNFEESNIANFKAVFENAKLKIRNFPGVMHLELLQSKDDPCIFFTYSHWKNPESLENYRQSPLFKETWKKTKILFKEPAQAWSSERLFSA